MLSTTRVTYRSLGQNKEQSPKIIRGSSTDHEREPNNDSGEQAKNGPGINAQRRKPDHNFKQNSVVYRDDEFVATRVLTEAVAKIVEASIGITHSISVNAFGQCLIEPTVVAPSPRRRGAPFAIDWASMELFLRDLANEGALPEKKEACIQELIDFSKTRFGRSVGRTTIQTRLRVALDELYPR